MSATDQGRGPVYMFFWGMLNLFSIGILANGEPRREQQKAV